MFFKFNFLSLCHRVCLQVQSGTAIRYIRVVSRSSYRTRILLDFSNTLFCICIRFQGNTCPKNEKYGTYAETQSAYRIVSKPYFRVRKSCKLVERDGKGRKLAEIDVCLAAGYVMVAHIAQCSLGRQETASLRRGLTA